MNLFPDGGGPPREQMANLVFRVLLLKRMAEDAAFGRAVVEICRQDVVFFISAFGWLREPRPKRGADGKELPQTIPFVPWPHQEAVLREMEIHLGYDDLIIDKARGEGATWMAIWMAVRDLVLGEFAKIGMVSFKADAVYKPNDVGTLLGKVLFALQRLPRTIIPNPKDVRYSGQKTIVSYVPTEGSITGYTSTEDVASGDRLRWAFMDELGKFPAGPDEEAVTSVQAVTESRLIVSTPKRASGAYYRMLHQESNIRKVVLDWTENPTRNRGLYRMVRGLPQAVDPVANPLPKHYNPPTQAVLQMFERLRARGYNLEEGVRSEWFDRQCDRAGATPEKIAREYGRNFGGAETQVLGRGFFAKCNETCRPPLKRGNVRWSKSLNRVVFEFGPQGPLSLWMPLDAYDDPPDSSYTIGIDIARGESLLGSNSVISIADNRSREQVLEYVTKIMEPKPLAVLAVGLAKWLGGAYLAWEQNGPGIPFGKRVLELRYHNVYVTRSLDDRGAKASKRAGWVSNPQTREELFDELGDAVASGELIIRSAECRDEGAQYVLGENGRIEHANPSNNVPNHGDRIIAAGVLRQAMKDRPYRLPEDGDTPPAKPPVGSMAWRDMLHDEAERAADEGFDERTIYDLMHPGSGVELASYF